MLPTGHARLALPLRHPFVLLQEQEEATALGIGHIALQFHAWTSLRVMHERESF